MEENEGMDKRKKIIIIATAISAVLITVGLLLGDMAVLGNLIIISLFIYIVPYFVYRYSRLVWIKGLEEQFPNFIRDLADSARSGMSPPEAIGIASKSNYGKLTEEVKKMNNRLSWGTPFLRVLEIFEKKVKDSKIIREALEIIRESYSAGGNTAETLDSIARDMIMLKEAEAERSSLVSQQVFIMYALFFIFLGISVMIIYVMVPMIGFETQGPSLPAGSLGFRFENPCIDISAFPCMLFSGICMIFGTQEGITCYYTALFFCVILIQGIFTGLIAGQLGENSVIAGMKHSLIMVFFTLGVFMFLAKIGFLFSL